MDFWGDDVIQCQLEGCKRNKDVYKKISRLMQEKGYIKTAVQCREKIKKLKGEYRKIKDQHNKIVRSGSFMTHLILFLEIGQPQSHQS